MKEQEVNCPITVENGFKSWNVNATLVKTTELKLKTPLSADYL